MIFFNDMAVKTGINDNPKMKCRLYVNGKNELSSSQYFDEISVSSLYKVFIYLFFFDYCLHLV